ncbi:MAG: LD-carboxypeptidase [Vicinamibacteria bacterium]
MIKPKALGPGSRIAIIAPGGPVVKAKMEAGLECLRAMGFEPVLGDHIYKKHLHQAGADEERMSDLIWSLTDPEIDGVICARGGEGATALLPWLESAHVEPRVFCGYSDVTALHAWLQRNGWVTFHGPMAAVEMSNGGFDMTSFIGEVTGVRTEHSLPVRFIRPGQAEGVLTGGCLSLLASLAGTEWALPWTGQSILLIEDVDEPPYKLHRMLTQLRDSNSLRDVRGIAFGVMANCAAKGGDDFTLEQILLDALSGFEGPIAIGLAAGHSDQPMLTLPLGTKVLLASDDSHPETAPTGRLHLIELGVTEEPVVDLEDLQ